MIKFLRKNLFNSNSVIIGNTVNCVGVMGKGIALEFKQRYPDYFSFYKTQCINKQFIPGYAYQYFDKSGKVIISLTTKNHWRQPSEYIYVEGCCIRLKSILLDLYNMNKEKYNYCAIPLLGCNNGQLDSEYVKQIMKRHFDNFDENILIEVCYI